MAGVPSALASLSLMITGRPTRQDARAPFAKPARPQTAPDDAVRGDILRTCRQLYLPG